MRAYWRIEGADKPLYTALPAKVVIDKKSGREYQTSEMIFLKKSDAPKKLIEDELNEYTYIPLRNESHIEGFFVKLLL